MIAMQAGGLAVLAGMTLVSGLVVVFLSRMLHRWRALFPPEVVGLIAFMVGASQVTLALSRFLGLNRSTDRLDLHYLLVASITLALMAGLTVWGRGRVRLFSSFVTLVAGFHRRQCAGFSAQRAVGGSGKCAVLDIPKSIRLAWPSTMACCCRS